MTKTRKHGNKEVKKPRQVPVPVPAGGPPALALPSVAPAAADRNRKR